MSSEDCPRNIESKAHPTTLQSPRPDNPPAANSSLPELTQVSSSPFQESAGPSPEFSESLQNLPSQQTRGQKRSRASDDGDDSASKRARTNQQSESELFEENLKRLNEDYLRKFDSDMNTNLNASSLKRSQSQKSNTSTSEANQDTSSVRSQRSSDISPAPYRFHVLDNVRAHVQWGPPPEEIQEYIRHVIRGETSQERTAEEAVADHRETTARNARLSSIAQGLINDFKTVFAGPVREDHSVDPIYTALSLMNSDGKLGLLKKADWETSLKPRQTDDFTWVPPKKRKQGESPADTMPPPPPKDDTSLVKTPRPDITLGPLHDTIVQRLIERGWTKSKADRTLKLQQEQQILISDPTKQGILRFPNLVVEGKAYATGKQFFEAENQCLVSGACMLNLQHQSTDLAELASSDCSDSKVPAIAFCISTEGPFLELSLVSTATVEGNREFNMYIIKSCHVCVFDELLDWVLFLKDVVNWIGSIYLDDVVNKIILADKAGWGQVPNGTHISSNSQEVGI